MITPAQVEEYEEKGFTVVQDAVTPEELAELRRVTGTVDGLLRLAKPQPPQRSAVDLARPRVDAALDVRDPGEAEPAEVLGGAPARVPEMTQERERGVLRQGLHALEATVVEVLGARPQDPQLEAVLHLVEAVLEVAHLVVHGRAAPCGAGDTAPATVHPETGLPGKIPGSPVAAGSSMRK